MEPSGDCEHTTNRFDALIDALHRGAVPMAGTCVEIGSGTGQHTGFLTEVFDQVIAVDISAQMLANAPAGVGTRARADAAALPIATASLAAAVCVDVFLYPGELTRVLRPDGALLWINQLGADGPLFVDTRP